MKKLLLLGAIAMVFGACSEKAKNEDPEPGPTPVDCETLSVSECADESACRTMSAWPADEDALCLLDAEDVGCLKADQACDDVEMWARDPGEGLWFFSNGCIPDGWEKSSPDEDIRNRCDDETPTECDVLSEKVCAEREDCAGFFAGWVDEEEECVTDSEFVGCGERDERCADIVTLARDPKRALWRFGSSCIPSGWSVETHNDDQHLINADFCAP